MHGGSLSGKGPSSRPLWGEDSSVRERMVFEMGAFGKTPHSATEPKSKLWHI